jgi:hypothetical protein
MASATKASVTFQASASTSAGGTTTGTGQDLTTALGCLITAKITNGATGPTVACDFIVEVSVDGSAWKEFCRATAQLGNNVVTEFSVLLPVAVMHARTKFTGNTAQAVTVEAFGHKVSTIA